MSKVDSTSTLQNVMDGLPTNVALSYAHTKKRDGVASDDFESTPKEVVVVLTFSEKGFGFGEVAIMQTDDGVFVNSECMSRDRVRRYLLALLDNAVFDTDTDPDHHALYNRVMGRTCSDGCLICGSP
jgi:hypothetical protein